MTLDPPRDIPTNRLWRAWILKKCQNRKRLWYFKERCQNDIFFWINTFVWSFDPRLKSTKTPFITYKSQDRALKVMLGALRPKRGPQRDVMLLKSRDEGGSWLCGLLFQWLWQFSGEQMDFFAMHYKEDYVTTGMKSIFGKFDFCTDHQPEWLCPKMSKTKMGRINKDSGSTFSGDSTTSRAGIGGRFTAMFFDEFPLVPDAGTLFLNTAPCSGCRIFNGTFNGTHTQFYRLSKLPDDQILKVRLHWSDNPRKNKGMYEKDGKLRSPWYDAMCRTLGHNKKAIAEILDIDAQSAGWQFFAGDEITRLMQQFASEPVMVGRMVGKQFQEMANGNLRLWVRPGGDGKGPTGRYGIGCDVASGVGGTYSTPSTASVVNLDTGEKVGELADPFLRPEKFAEVIKDIAVFFREAIVIWEINGPGAAFRRELMTNLEYGNVYFRRRSGNSLAPEITDDPGFMASAESNRTMLERYRQALSDGTFFNPSKAALAECLEFVYDGRSVSHALKLNKDDPAGSGANHGDLVTADALANLLLEEDGAVFRKAKLTEEDLPPPVGSMAWRDQLEAQTSLAADGWGEDSW